MSLDLPKCACGCGAAVVRTGKRGRAPRYASAACRKRAERSRRADSYTIERLPDLADAPPIQVAARSSDEQVQRAILEARAVGFAFLRLGTVARPELAWRCARVGQSIVDVVGDTFGKGMTE